MLIALGLLRRVNSNKAFLIMTLPDKWGPESIQQIPNLGTDKGKAKLVRDETTSDTS